MPKKGDPPETRVALRRDAEARLERKPATQPPQTEANQRLQHELEVHEVELELQNEELRISQAELRAALERSSDVFDFAPVGYFGLAADGAIGLLNHDGASLVGLECGELKGRHFQAFLTEPDQPVFNDFLQRVFSSTSLGLFTLFRAFVCGLHHLVSPSMPPPHDFQQLFQAGMLKEVPTH